jgi:hypothetical protein
MIVPWADQGLGIQSRDYYISLKELGYTPHIFSFKPYHSNESNKLLQCDKSEWDSFENVYYSNSYRENIKNQLLDTLVYASLFALSLGLKALPDDDDDPIVKNQYKFLLKATDKFKDELGYFYNPTNLTNLVSTGIFPSMGLIKNYTNAVTKFMTENYAIATGNEELEDKNDVIKYWMRSFPITNQAAGLLPMFYPDLAKDLGIKMQSQYGFK